MTGSISAVILIPIVVTISLVAWLILVFYADSHPRWRIGSSPARSNPAPAAWARTRPDAPTGMRSYVAEPGRLADASWSVPAQYEPPEDIRASRPKAHKI